MICKYCNQEIKQVIVVSYVNETGVLEGDKIIKYDSGNTAKRATILCSKCRGCLTHIIKTK